MVNSGSAGDTVYIGVGGRILSKAAQETSWLEGADLEPDPVVEHFKRDVDRTLIRAQLRRSVDERVRSMIAALRFAEALREAGRRQQEP